MITSIDTVTQVSIKFQKKIRKSPTQEACTRRGGLITIVSEQESSRPLIALWPSTNGSIPDF